MTFEIIVGIFGLSVAIAQVAVEKRNKRAKLISWFVGSAALILVFYAAYEVIQQTKKSFETEQLANKVTAVLKRPMTFDDIHQSMNFPDFEKLNEAIDWMYDRSFIKYEIRNDIEINGSAHSVRLIVSNR